MMLEKRYMGYFEAGRHGARRHHLVWRVLESTFHNDKPLFALCRKAAMLPEAVGESDPTTVLDDVSELVERGELRVREDSLAMGEILVATVRRDWPFLARFHAGGHGDPGIPFRPALLLLLVAATGRPDARRIQAAAAIELGYSAALAHVSVEEAPAELNGSRNGHEPSANWGNMLALLAGDFFLSKAYAMSAQCGATASEMIAESLCPVCESRMRREQLQGQRIMNESVQEEIATGQVATLFELPCRLGALLGNLNAQQTEAARM